MLASLWFLAMLSTGPVLPGAAAEGADGEKVADDLVDRGFDREATAQLRTLLTAWPQAARRPVWQAKVLRAVSRAGDREAFAGEASLLVGEILAARRLRPGTDLTEAERLADELLRTRMTTWHLEGKQPRRANAESAEGIFRLWFSLFDSSPLAGDMHFFHGEVLVVLDRMDSAADACERSTIASPRGRWAEAAAEGAVRASQEVVKKERATSSWQPGTPPPAPQPLTPAAARLVRVSDAYVAAAPTFPVRILLGGGSATESFMPGARFQAARVFYEAWHLDEASARFLSLIETAPESPQAEIAAHLILDIDNVREDYAALDRHARLLERYLSSDKRR